MILNFRSKGFYARRRMKKTANRCCAFKCAARTDGFKRLPTLSSIRTASPDLSSTPCVLQSITARALLAHPVPLRLMKILIVSFCSSYTFRCVYRNSTLLPGIVAIATNMLILKLLLLRKNGFLTLLSIACTCGTAVPSSTGCKSFMSEIFLSVFPSTSERQKRLSRSKIRSVQKCFSIG